MKLLLAEDEVDMSEALVDILTYHKYTVDAVFDGEEALDYATIGEYDGIILDIMMPKMSGLEVLQKLRSRGDRTPDNRPLNFQEFESKIDKILYVSATPSDYEKEHEENRVEQIIRPTGLLDPEVEVRPIEGQVDDRCSAWQSAGR